MDNNIVLRKLDAFKKDLLLIQNWMNLFLQNQEVIKQLQSEVMQDSYLYFFENIEEYNTKSDDITNLITIIETLKNKDYNNVCKHYEVFWKKDIEPYSFSNNYKLSVSKKIEIQDVFNKWKNRKYDCADDEINICDQVVDILSGTCFELKEKINAIALMDKIKNINDNIVLVGANGSGKSTYSKALSNVMSNNVSMNVLASQHYLRYTVMGEWSETDAIEDLHQFQKNPKYDIEDSYNIDLSKVINALLDQYYQTALDYYNGQDHRKSNLHRVIELWGLCFPNINIKIDRYRLYPEDKNGNKYDFNDLSDGEKTAFYYLAHVITSEENAYIIVDEPENHMNSGLCRNLWNLIERERPDCKFIYITHDLEFATTRLAATILWNKKFISSEEWDVIQIDGIEDLPQELIIEILGSKSKLLFCEGKNKSYDKKLYSILYPNTTVIGVESHKNVIDYTSAYRKNTIFPMDAIGIIDRDWHDEKWIESIENKGIIVLKINEIENILCDEKVLLASIEWGGFEKDSIEKYFEVFWERFEERIPEQAKRYVIYQINSQLKNNLFNESSSLEQIVDKITNDMSVQKLNDKVNERTEELKSYFDDRNYSKALRVINFKGALLAIANKNITSNYANIALKAIEKNPDLQEYLRKEYIDQK